MASLLFPEPQVPRTGPMGRVEPAVHWFTEVTHDEASVSRSRVTRGMENFLMSMELSQQAGLRSEIDADHYQSLRANYSSIIC